MILKLHTVIKTHVQKIFVKGRLNVVKVTFSPWWEKKNTVWSHSGICTIMKKMSDIISEQWKNMDFNSQTLCVRVCVHVCRHSTYFPMSSHKQPAPSVSGYCSFRSTAHENGQIKGVQEEVHSGRVQAHSYGSVLQFLITVISDWLPLLHLE